MVEQLMNVEKPGQPDGDRHPRQHAQGRLGRDESLHHRPAPGGQLADAGGAVHRPRLALALRQTRGVGAVDRLTIVSHDKFQEIVDDANRPGFGNPTSEGHSRSVYGPQKTRPFCRLPLWRRPSGNRPATDRFRV